MSVGLTVADLARDPLEVAEALPQWKRGDQDEAVAATLALAARQMHGRAPVVWVWSGRTPDDCAAWIVPVPADQARDFAPRAPARLLIGLLRAAVDAGALADAISLLDWRGLVLLTLPGLDEDLVPLALADALPDAGTVAVAPLPAAVAPDGDDIPLVGPPARMDADDPLTALATATWSHPIRVALTLGAHGQPMDAPSYPAEIVTELRRWGLDGTPPPPGARSLAVEDDPCPRRRHARTVLRPVPHGVRPPVPRRGTREPARCPRDRRGHGAGRAAGREAQRGTAARVPAARGASRHPRADRPGGDPRPRAGSGVDGPGTGRRLTT